MLVMVKTTAMIVGGDGGDKVQFVCGSDWEKFDVVDCGGRFVGSVGLDCVMVGFSGVQGEPE